MNSKKITLATVKSFIKKNAGNIYINVKSSFDGMIDGHRMHNSGFEKANNDNHNPENSLGIAGAWFVGGSRDYFSGFENENFTGIEVSNCCDHFILAIRK